MKRYLVIFAFTTSLVLALTAFMAWLVDPYAYWNTPVVRGVNEYRPDAGRHMVVVKLRQYARAKPKTLIAGNSRVDAGMNPASDVWPESMRPVYNLGIPGEGAAGVVRLVDRALLEHRPNAVFIGLDFLDFRVSDGPRTPLRPLTQPGLRETLSLHAKLLLSLDALNDTAGALVEQHKAYPGDITPLGFNALAQYNRLVAIEGHAALFRQRNRENMISYLNGPKSVRLADGSNPQFEALGSLVETTKRGRIAVVFFTFPYHADILLSFRKAGLWPAYEAWLRDLANFSARTGVVTYMFTRLDGLTAEPVPAPGDTKTRMQWYWEAGHFKAALGEAMVKAMTRSPDPALALSPETVEAHLARLRSDMDAYAANNGAGVARVEAAFSEATR